MAKKESRVLRQQKIAVGSIGLVVLAVAAYLFWMTVDEAPLGEFVEGEHYYLIENPRRIRSEQIEVMEFFSYACVHCYNFNPILTDWAAKKGSAIKLIQTPAVASEYWRLLGRNFLTYQALGELDKYTMPFFRAIHDSRRVFSDPESLFDFYEQLGGDRQAFEAAFNSTAVASELSKADAMARRLQVAAVPTVIVQGKYMVRTSNTVGPKRMLDIIDHLIEKEQAEYTRNSSDG